MMAKCRHRKLIMAHAYDVVFTPDQEPFESGKIEPAGVEDISCSTLIMHYCPKCKEATVDCDGVDHS